MNKQYLVMKFIHDENKELDHEYEMFYKVEDVFSVLESAILAGEKIVIFEVGKCLLDLS